jgi:hypothetical protein
MMNKIIAILLTLSVILNIYLFNGRNIDQAGKDETCFRENENISSLDDSFTPHLVFPMFKGYSLTGELMEFLDFYLKGTIVSSVKNKYEIDVPLDFVRNIQEIVYFFNDYKILFSEGDRISVFYRSSDRKIVYLRFENSRRRSVHETFLFQINGSEVYVTGDGSLLQPCITNGPFKNCPQIRFTSEHNSLVPVFETGLNKDVFLPFMAKIVGMSNSSSSGGELEVIYSNHLIKAVFKGLNSLNSNLKNDRIYNHETYVGKSGYPLSGEKSGVVYYLRKRDGSVLSPFSFHHIEKKYVPENRKQNLLIASNFYTRWFRSGINFEKKYY